jgi:trehalose/maltose hydrolase-like predicted phosphorylase
MIVEDEEGRKTLVESRRMASMDDRHIAALEYTIKPLIIRERLQSGQV